MEHQNKFFVYFNRKLYGAHGANTIVTYFGYT